MPTWSEMIDEMRRRQGQPGASTYLGGDPVYKPRYDKNASMPTYSRQPGDISGYAPNPHQQALIDALRNKPAMPASAGTVRPRPDPVAPQPASMPQPAPGGSSAPQFPSANQGGLIAAILRATGRG